MNLDYGQADFGLPYQHPRAKTGRGNLHPPLTALVRHNPKWMQRETYNHIPGY